MKKQNYQTPDMEIQLLSEVDIVTISQEDEGELVDIGWGSIDFK